MHWAKNREEEEEEEEEERREQAKCDKDDIKL